MSSKIFNRIFHTESGQILISIIWGLGLALMFCYQMCDGEQCIVFKAPPVNVKDTIFAHENACYSFIPYSSDCDNCNVKSTPDTTDKKCNKRRK